ETYTHTHTHTQRHTHTHTHTQRHTHTHTHTHACTHTHTHAICRYQMLRTPSLTLMVGCIKCCVRHLSRSWSDVSNVAYAISHAHGRMYQMLRTPSLTLMVGCIKCCVRHLSRHYINGHRHTLPQTVSLW